MKTTIDFVCENEISLLPKHYTHLVFELIKTSTSYIPF